MVTIGRIVRTQGKRGELRLKIYSDNLIELLEQKVYLEGESSATEYRIEYLRPYKGNYLLKLKEVDTLSKAQELAGSEVSVPKEWLKRLEEDDYYSFQVVGCSVATKDRKNIGRVEDFLLIENNNLLVVKQGKKEVLIPFTRSICLKVDLEKREIIVDLPEGLLELNEI